MTALCKLSISCNSLTSIPPALGSVTTLNFLDVSFNMITTLPFSLSELTQLQAFNGAFNPLGFLSSDSAVLDPKSKTKKQITDQQKPALRQQDVGDLPPVLFALPSLRELNLDYTGCRNVDSRFEKLSGLRALQMEGNEMEPAWWQIYIIDPILLVHLHNPTLDSLDLSDCKLADLPPSVGGLRSLQSLNLSGNAFVTLPAVLGELTSLQDLNLDGNPLAPHLAAILEKGKQQDEGEGEAALLRLLDASQPTLHLDDLSLRTVPDEVFWHREHLIVLDLRSNKLRNLPTSMSTLQRLKHLNVNNNKLTDIPESLCTLSALRVLQAAHNQISRIPNSITNLKRLHMLALGANCLAALPDFLSSLQRLECLSCPENRIAAYPSNLCNLPALNMLDLSANAIVTLPQDFESLTSLTSLRISENKIVAVPEGLTSLQTLAQLSVRDNPVSAAVSKPQAQSRDDVIKLLRELLLHARDPSSVTAAEDRASEQLQASDHKPQQSKGKHSREAARSCHLADQKLMSKVEALDNLNSEPSEESVSFEHCMPRQCSITSRPVRFADNPPVKSPAQSPAQSLSDPSTASKPQQVQETVKTQKIPKREAPVAAAPPSDGTEGPLAVSPDLLHAALGMAPIYIASDDALPGGTSEPKSALSKGKNNRHTTPADSSPGAKEALVAPQEQSLDTVKTTLVQAPVPPPQKDKGPNASAVPSPRKPPLSPLKAANPAAGKDPAKEASVVATNAAIESPADTMEDSDTFGEHEVLFAKLLSRKERPKLPSLQAEGKNQSTTHDTRAKTLRMKQEEEQSPPQPLPSITAPSDAKPNKQGITPQLANDAQQSPRSSKKQQKSAQGSHTQKSPSDQKDAAPQLDHSKPAKDAAEAQVQALKSPEAPSSRHTKRADTDENSFLQPSAADQKPGALPSLHSTWGLQTTAPRSPTHQSMGLLEGSLHAGGLGGNITLARVRSPLSAARHEKRQQRWLEMADHFNAKPLNVDDPGEEQARQEQLSAEAMVQSLKRAQQPPEATFPGAASGGQGASQLPMRPNVRKRFERVMASQISTLNQLIASAAKGRPRTASSSD